MLNLSGWPSDWLYWLHEVMTMTALLWMSGRAQDEICTVLCNGPAYLYIVFFFQKKIGRFTPAYPILTCIFSWFSDLVHILPNSQLVCAISVYDQHWNSDNVRLKRNKSQSFHWCMESIMINDYSLWDTPRKSEVDFIAATSSWPSTHGRNLDCPCRNSVFLKWHPTKVVYLQLSVIGLEALDQVFSFCISW